MKKPLKDLPVTFKPQPPYFTLDCGCFCRKLGMVGGAVHSRIERPCKQHAIIEIYTDPDSVVNHVNLLGEGYEDGLRG